MPTKIRHRPESVPEDHKWCPGCEKTLKKTEFHISRVNKDGRQGWCKYCTREAVKYSRAKNRAKWDKIDPYTGKPYDEGASDD